MLNTAVNFVALDRPDSPARIRLGATVIRVEHAPGGGVAVTYEKDGELYRTRAPRVVMASAGWINRHLLADLPGDLRAAYGEFQYAPALSANFALTNWRFLYKLGSPAVRYFEGGFGWSCNIRRPMTAGSYQPVMHPDEPVALTFYLGLYAPGHDAGFRASQDIAGIVLNRRGHARVIQPPGFYYGRDGKPSPRETVQKGYGRIAIAHFELNGHQNATGALQQGKRAGEQVLG